MSSSVKVFLATFGVVVVAVCVAAAVYFLAIKDNGNSDNSNGASTSANGVQVTSLLFSNRVDQNGVPINPSNAIAAGTQGVRAAIVLQGVKPGMTVEGRWYQLGPAEAGPEGAEISTSQVDLTADNVDTSTNQASIFFTLGTSGSALPEDAWLLRIYVDGTLVKTGGFVISSLVGSSSGTPTSAPPEPSPTPTP